MKVKVISRSADEFTRERSQDLQVILKIVTRTLNFLFRYLSLLKNTKFHWNSMINQRVYHNYDPNLRPQEKAVEYVRALNAAKLEKVYTQTRDWIVMIFSWELKLIDWVFQKFYSLLCFRYLLGRLLEQWMVI